MGTRGWGVGLGEMGRVKNNEPRRGIRGSWARQGGSIRSMGGADGKEVLGAGQGRAGQGRAGQGRAR